MIDNRSVCSSSLSACTACWSLPISRFRQRNFPTREPANTSNTTLAVGRAARRTMPAEASPLTGRRGAESFYTVYYKPPPDPRARRRRRLLARISCIFSLSLLAAGPIMFAVLRAQSECSIDIQCASANQWLLRRRRDGASIRRKNETTTLLVVAHPGDEEVWAGDLLESRGAQVHVMVTSTLMTSRARKSNDDADTYAVDRSEIFRRTSDKYGFVGEYLWGGLLDTYPNKPHWELERAIKRRITARVCDRPWDAIVTHGDDGEFCHPQHRAVHEAVVESIYHCCNSTARLLLFQPDEPDTMSAAVAAAMGRTAAAAAAAAATDSYETEKSLFQNWTTNIVTYRDFDYDLAGRICRAYRKPGRKYKSLCRGDGYVSDSSDDLFRRKKKFRHKGRC